MQQTRPFGFMINLVARQLERRMAESLRPLHLTPAYLPVILTLAETQPRTQTELATSMNIRQPTMARTLRRMERDGLIIRKPHPDDQRATAITLTDKTMSLLTRIQVIGRQISDDALAELPPERRTQLMADLATISIRLDAYN